jgi:hypothetical protein
LSNTRAAVTEEAGELARYRADLLAASLPVRVAALAGAIGGFVVFFVPIGVVGGSMLAINLTFNIGILPLQWLVRTLGIRITRSQSAVEGPNIATTAVARLPAVPTAEATQIPPLPPEGVEGAIGSGSTTLLAAVLVLFWPLAMLAVGALVASLYRWRRQRVLPALLRSPIELAVWPEVLLFYVLTAGAALLVGVGTFVALGANVAFAWAGYLIWRWLFDRVAWRLAPAAAQQEALTALAREREYRKRARESG